MTRNVSVAHPVGGLIQNDELAMLPNLRIYCEVFGSVLNSLFTPSALCVASVVGLGMAFSFELARDNIEGQTIV